MVLHFGGGSPNGVLTVSLLISHVRGTTLHKKNSVDTGPPPKNIAFPSNVTVAISPCP